MDSILNFAGSGRTFAGIPKRQVPGPAQAQIFGISAGLIRLLLISARFDEGFCKKSQK